ncbi:hypothetical protein, partial [uncultured Parasutterella sp.]|uniref:hypothetical protein n=1 Tax=uncultured Parasutterella sp. TaxID=1263098 RepID=UPI0025B2F66C
CGVDHKPLGEARLWTTPKSKSRRLQIRFCKAKPPEKLLTAFQSRRQSELKILKDFQRGLGKLFPQTKDRKTVNAGSPSGANSRD